MSSQRNNVVIQEPPLQELNKKRSCLKRTCFTGFGCITLFLIGSLLLLKFAAGPKKKELKKVPADIVEHIPLYDMDNIDTITVISGEDRHELLEAVAYIPKVALAPIIIALEENTAAAHAPQESTWSRFSAFVKNPITDQRDAITIEWSYLTAEPSFVYTHYQQELERKNFIIVDADIDGGTKQILFEKNTIEGSLVIKDARDEAGTDYVTLTLFSP